MFCIIVWHIIISVFCADKKNGADTVYFLRKCAKILLYGSQPPPQDGVTQ